MFSHLHLTVSLPLQVRMWRWLRLPAQDTYDAIYSGQENRFPCSDSQWASAFIKWWLHGGDSARRTEISTKTAVWIPEPLNIYSSLVVLVTRSTSLPSFQPFPSLCLRRRLAQVSLLLTWQSSLTWPPSPAACRRVNYPLLSLIFELMFGYLAKKLVISKNQ